MPLLVGSRAEVGKIAYGRLMGREEADRVISCSTLLNTRTNKYECTVCGGAFQVGSLLLYS